MDARDAKMVEPDEGTDASARAAVHAAMEVQRALGPGLLESTYEHCPARELGLRSTPFRRQVELSVRYKGERIDAGYRLDLVDERVIVEIKAVERLLPIHDAQLLTYLKLSGLCVGLLMNFNTVLLKDGLKRLVSAA